MFYRVYVWAVMFFIFVSNTAYGQNSLIDFANNRTIIQYVENPVLFHLAGVKSGDLKIKTSSNVKLEYKAEEEQYILTGLERGTGWVKLGRVHLSDTLWDQEINFRITSLKTPKGKLGCISSDLSEKNVSIPRAAILAQNKIFIDNGYDIYPENLKYKVESFRIGVIGSESSIYRVDSCVIPIDVKSCIASALPGTLIFIDQIVVNCPATDFHKLAKPTMFKVSVKGDHEYFPGNLMVSAELTNAKGEPINLVNEGNDWKILNALEEINEGWCRLKFQNSSDTVSIYNRYSEGRLMEQIRMRGSDSVFVTKRKNDSLFHWKGFYTSGGVNTICEVTKDMNYGGVLSVNGKSVIGLFSMDQRVDEFEDLVNQISLKHGYTPHGSFLSYHENGELKTSGELRKREPEFERSDFSVCVPPMPHQVNISSVFDGKWKIYNESGKLVETRSYDFGNLITK